MRLSVEATGMLSCGSVEGPGSTDLAGKFTMLSGPKGLWWQEKSIMLLVANLIGGGWRFESHVGFTKYGRGSKFFSLAINFQ